MSVVVGVGGQEGRAPFGRGWDTAAYADPR